MGFTWPLLVKQGTLSIKFVWFHSSVFNSLNTQRSTSIIKWTGIEGTTFPSFLRTELHRSKWDRAEAALSSPWEEFCPSAETASRSIPKHSASVLLMKAFALQPPYQVSWHMNAAWKKIIYWKQFIGQILTFAQNSFQQFIISWHPQTVQRQQITFWSFFTAPEHLLSNKDFYYLTSTPVKAYFVPTFSVVALKKQRKKDTWWHF